MSAIEVLADWDITRQGQGVIAYRYLWGIELLVSWMVPQLLQETPFAWSWCRNLRRRIKPGVGATSNACS